MRSVGGFYYVTLKGSVDVYHRPWTHDDDHVFEATGGYGVNVRADGPLSSGAASDGLAHLGLPIGCIHEGEGFGDYRSSSATGVRRTHSIISRGFLGDGGASGPTEVLKVSAACALRVCVGVHPVWGCEAHG